MSQYQKSSQPASKLSTAKALGIAALLSSISTSALAQEKIYDVLSNQGYRQTFEYNFGNDTKPEDINGTKIWERNLWYQGNVDPNDLIKHDSYYALMTPNGNPKQVTSSALATWSKSKKSSLYKFHYGYFEATMRFKVSGTNWPAFWALSTTLPLMPQAPGGLGFGRWCEIDVFEGGNPGIFSANVHDWVAHHSNDMKIQHTPLPVGTNFDNWNTYGALWTKDTIKFYFNGMMVNEAPTPKPCQDDDLFLILSSQSRDASSGIMELDVKNVRVFTK